MVSRIVSPGTEPGARQDAGNDPCPDNPEVNRIDDGEADMIGLPDRREALAKMTGLAAYVGPAMTVLVAGSASAHHKIWHTANCRNFPNSPNCQSPA